jgi:hypothetical protein
MVDPPDQQRAPIVVANVVNGSDQPVYDAELVWRCGADPYGGPNPQPLRTVMPRRHQARSRWFHQRARLARNYALVSYRG